MSSVVLGVALALIVALTGVVLAFGFALLTVRKPWNCGAELGRFRCERWLHWGDHRETVDGTFGRRGVRWR